MNRYVSSVSLSFSLHSLSLCLFVYISLSVSRLSLFEKAKSHSSTAGAESHRRLILADAARRPAVGPVVRRHEFWGFCLKFAGVALVFMLLLESDAIPARV